MKSFLPTLLFLFAFNITFAQLGFEAHYVYGEASYNESLCLEDITNNGHLDIIYSTTYAGSGDSVKFVTNVNGEGSFASPSYISSLNFATSIHAADLDGDNDLDIITANSLEDKVSWHRNEYNGFIYFDTDAEEIITETQNAPSSVFAEDIDGDGDLDVLVTSAYDDTVAWYENTDGLGNFGSKQIIFNNADGACYIESADVDGDGDMDLLVASNYDNVIRWFKNTDGLGTFVLGEVITTFVSYVYKATFADVDGDGDLDVLSVSSSDSKIAWYENTDGLGSFGAQQIISTELSFPKEIESADLDNDGDLDIIASYGSYGGTVETAEIVWIENLNGLGTFGSIQSISGPGHGAHSISVKDIDEDGILDIAFVSSSDMGWYKNLGISSNEISGYVKLDTNLTGCTNPNVDIPNIFVTTTNGTETLTSMTLNNSLYQLFPGEGDYTTTIASQLPSYFNVYPSSYDSSFTGYSNTDTANFCLQRYGVVDDLSISLYPLSDPRPGFDIIYKLVYRNNGNTELTGNVALEFDDEKIQYITANENVVQDSDTSLSLSFTDLSPFEIRTIDLRFNVFQIPTTNIDDVIEFTATVNPIAGDETPDNNVFLFKDLVIGAYDPNDIRVLEGETVHIDDSDDYLHYIIRFQNTGTAEAINVNVENTLDDKLDWTTMQLESLSHDGRVEITNNTQVNFIFNDINLPDSTNDEPNSHGYIAYKIKPINSVQISDIVENTADIYFDFNPAITTNTVSTEFVEQLSNADHDLNNFSIFPNPTSGFINISSKTAFHTISVIDINGRNLKEIQFNNHTLNTELDLSHLKSGVYFLNINSNLKTTNVKVMVK
ncbi:T9SS type A sorting domain-containing protein [Winogradskyella eckloniae]|uniref:DUF7619 domain-containing protein n=1 Tax=Winogradskyella eckloniae TaxID=1089306 RepID=UPI00156533C1|nr:FG-GAP-like repeat-containing protein [Winogradskyella eckloniae]NRD18782.1 T9SS type A sorting domain-containing protein [Winogradskyella eckloniae]